MIASERPTLLRNLPAWFGIGVGKCIARLPWFCYKPMAWLLARLMEFTMRKRAHIARINIARCFPELSIIQQQQLLRRSFDSLAFAPFEFARGWWGKLRKQDIPTKIIGLEHLHRAQAQGCGVIMVSAHLMTMEYCIRILTQHCQLAGMYRSYDQAVLEYSVREARKKYTQQMFRRHELRPMLKHLKNAGILWFAPDQETRVGESVFVPFFNQMAYSLTSTHQLAKLSGAMVLPFFHQRLPNGNYAIEIGTCLENFPSNDAHADTARIMAIFESMIRRCPEQYLWLHARFKRQLDGVNPYQTN